jgi:hypothetical protein
LHQRRHNKTSSITTFNLRDLNATLSTECLCAEDLIFIVMPSVVVLTIGMLNVVAPNQNAIKM